MKVTNRRQETKNKDKIL